MIKLAVAAALLAAVLSGAALMVALGSQPPDPYNQVCGQTLVSNGRQIPVWTPCKAGARP